MEEAYVIGDIHLGMRNHEQEFEDISQDKIFFEWIKSISEPDTILFINGDFIDFVHIPPYNTHKEHHLLWTENVSLRKIKSVVSKHPLFFDALKYFFEHKGKLRIIIGNRDLDFAWNGVQQYLRKILGCVSKEQLRFRIGNIKYHGVLIEHGHSFTRENSTINPKHFIYEWPDRNTSRAGSSTCYIERVWGTDFALSLFKEFESKNPNADKIKPSMALLYYGLRNKWFGAQEFVRLILFIKRHFITRNSINSAISNAIQPDFNHLLNSIADNEWKQLFNFRGQKDKYFEKEVNTVIKILPWKEKIILATDSQIEIEPSPLFNTIEAKETGRNKREIKVAQKRLAMKGITHVIFGHTHEIINGMFDGAFFNPGSWVPHFYQDNSFILEKIKKNGLTKHMLNNKSLYKIERRAIHITPKSRYCADLKLISI